MQFSSRTNWTLAPNQLTKRLSALEQSGTEILDLTESNPTQVGFQYSSDVILSSLTDSKNLSYQPSPLGIREARETVAEYYNAKGASVHPDQILLTASTSEAYSAIFRLIANPGERVLMPRPSYPLFHFLTGLNDVELDPYTLTYHKTWRIDFDGIRKSFKPKTKAIVLVNPNNPTGSFVKKDELVKLNQFAEGNQLCIISDEVFADFQWEKKTDGLTTLAGNHQSLTFTLSGISKVLGLPQMKISWIVVSGPKELVRQSIERLEIILDTYLSVNAPAQNALHHWMQLKDRMQKQILKRVLSNRSFLQKSGQLEMLEADAGWYAVLKLPKKKSEEDWAIEILEKDHVLVHPGYFYDFQEEPFIVVSLLVDPSVFEAAITKISKRVAVSQRHSETKICL